MEFRKEYFKSHYYFYLKEGKNDNDLPFNTSNNNFTLLGFKSFLIFSISVTPLFFRY